MIRSRKFSHQPRSLPWSLLQEMAVSPRVHCRIVLVRALIHTLALMSLANGIFSACFSVCRHLMPPCSPNSRRTNFSIVGILLDNTAISILIMTDFSCSYRNRNLLQRNRQSIASLNVFYLLFLPLSVFPLAAYILEFTAQLLNTSPLTGLSGIEMAWDASCTVTRLLLLVFVAAARTSTDTGEIIHQTLLRYTTIVYSISGMLSLCLYDSSLDAVRSFAAVILATETIPTSMNPLVALSGQYQFYCSKMLVVGGLIGILLLLEPLRIVWHLLQQRLTSVSVPVVSEEPPRTGVIVSCHYHLPRTIVF